MAITVAPDLLENKKFKEFIDSFEKILSGNQPLSETRKLCKEFFLPPSTVFEPVKNVSHILVPSKDGYEIPVRIYTPEASSKLPLLIYFHRGGWVFGSLAEADPICRKLANHLKCIVASVDYRLAPEHPFPKPLEDAYSATVHLTKNAEALDANPHKVIVAGESAGGNLAASVAIMNRDKKECSLHAQLLIYPLITSSIDPAVYSQSVDKYFLTHQSITFFWNMYLGDKHLKDSYASLDLNDNLQGVPPAYIITADYDALHKEAQNYAKKLSYNGVQVITKCFPEVIHGFLDLPIYEESAKKAWLDEIRKIMSRHL